MKRTFALAACFALVFLSGCSRGPKLVPVSGVVKVNGKPYPNAVVSFQPVGSKNAENPGRGSVGITDENGRFTLQYDGQKPGALVGQHRVRIYTQMGGGIPDTEGDPEAASKAAKQGKSRPERLIEPIPAEWHENSTKTFEVPKDGTSEANFNIDSPLMKKAGK